MKKSLFLSVALLCALAMFFTDLIPFLLTAVPAAGGSAVAVAGSVTLKVTVIMVAAGLAWPIIRSVISNFSHIADRLRALFWRRRPPVAATAFAAG